MKKRRLFIGFVVLLLLLFIAGIAWGWLGNGNNDSQKTYSQLTGVAVDPTVAERPILGIIVENTEAARPQTGLDSAGIVFEAVTEGGITRYLALYQENMPEEVGPVRSLRVHFLNWAMGFDASIAHVGGSPGALELADERDAKSLNQFKYGEPYRRDDSRAAPHNVYASTEELRNLQSELGHSKSQFKEIPRSSENPNENPQAASITIDYSRPSYQVQFRYQESGNSYTRYLAGSPHIDSATNQPISVKNVIVIKTDRQGDIVDATGSGEALVFKDGGVQTVRWQKSSFDSRIEIIDNENNEISLNRGDSWFAVLPEDKAVTY